LLARFSRAPWDHDAGVAVVVLYTLPAFQTGHHFLNSCFIHHFVLICTPIVPVLIVRLQIINGTAVSQLRCKTSQQWSILSNHTYSLLWPVLQVRQWLILSPLCRRKTIGFTVQCLCASASFAGMSTDPFPLDFYREAVDARSYRSLQIIMMATPQCCAEALILQHRNPAQCHFTVTKQSCKPTHRRFLSPCDIPSQQKKDIHGR